MRILYRRGIRHPFYPKLPVTPAARATGSAMALSGTYSNLREAAARGVTAKRMVLVVHDEGAQLLSAAERNRLWELFQVPIYAIVLNSKRCLVRFECEAQNGLHLCGPESSAPSLCQCGRPGQRVQTEAASDRSAAARLLPADA